MNSTPILLYGFWRSNAAYRVRVALNLKGVAYREIPIDLDKGEQSAPDFLARNPMGAVPAMIIGDHGSPITQSLAILDYIEECYPEPPLLPKDALGRARVRGLAADVACDSHPLIVPRVKAYLRDHAGFDDAAFRAWQRHWITTGLQAIESKLSTSDATGRFCHGDVVTSADICVSGLAMAARLFKFEVETIPTVTRIVETCFADPAFAKADPLKQADSPRPA